MDEARDLLWTYNSPELYELLVLQRGWTPQRYGRWLADALTAALLPLTQAGRRGLSCYPRSSTGSRLTLLVSRSSLSLCRPRHPAPA